eukprot:758153-Hanusia_phi.AAC.3
MVSFRLFAFLQLLSTCFAELHASPYLHAALSSSTLQHTRQNLPLYMADARRGNKAHVLQESGSLGANLEILSNALYDVKQGVVDMSRVVQKTAGVVGSFAVEKTQISIDRATELYKEHPKEAVAAASSIVVLTALLRAFCPKKEEEKVVKGTASSLQDTLKQTSRLIQGCTATVSRLLVQAAAALGNQTEAALNTTQDWYENQVKVGAQETFDLFQALWAALSESGGEAARTILQESKNVSTIGLRLSKHVSKVVSTQLELCKDSTAHYCEEIRKGLQLYSIPHTIKSGKMSSRRFVVDLGRSVCISLLSREIGAGEERRIGGLLISNKPTATKDKQVKSGTKDFEILVSNDGKKWRTAHKVRRGGEGMRRVELSF